MTEHMFDFKSISTDSVENLDIIPEIDRKERPSSLFWLWFASNLTIGDFAIGLVAQLYSLGFVTTLLALAIGTVLGGVLLASMSLMGPVFGMSQMRIGRYTFGKRGGILMSVLQWGNTLGWFTFNSIIAASALSLAFDTSSYIYPILITVLLVLVLTILGYKTIHIFEKIMSAVLGSMFVVIMAYSIDKIGIIGNAPVFGAFSAVSFGWIVAFSFSYIMSWGPYASDYSRYLPVKSSPKKIFILVFAGASLASFFAEIAGYYVGLATLSTSSNPAEPMQLFLGKYALVGLYFLFLGGLAANAINLYSNSMSIRAAGIRVNRRYISISVAALAVILSYIGYKSFYVSYENFLFILDYWITPWIAVMIVDFFIRSRRDTKLQFTEVFNIRAISAYLIGIIVSIPFMYPSSYYVGPIAKILGVDISYFISFAVAGILYYLLETKKTNRLITQAVS